MKHKPNLSILMLSLAGALSFACGGGGGSSSGSRDDTDSATVSGVVFASKVDGATVRFLDMAGNVVAGPTTTNTDGEYALPLPNDVLAESLILEATGGTYVDEATQDVVTLEGNLMAQFNPNTLTHGTVASATAYTTLVRELVRSNGNTLDKANTMFEEAFGFNPDPSIEPIDVTDATASANASDGAALAGLRAARFSQLTADMGLEGSKQIELVQSLAMDLGDGALDGRDAQGSPLSIGEVELPRDMASRYATAAINFRSSGNDHSGQIELPPVVETLYSSGNSYRVEWVNRSTKPTVGYYPMTLRITDAETGVAATGLSLSSHPTMYMGTTAATRFLHGTPVGHTIVESTTTPGDYTSELYFLMSSGSARGFWEIKTMGLGEEKVKLYPEVAAASGDTTQFRFRGHSGDNIQSNSSIMHSDTSASETMEPNSMDADDSQEQIPRTYYVFPKSFIEGTSGHDLTVFIAANESLMSYPALSSGNMLSHGTDQMMAIDSVVLNLTHDDTTYAAIDLGMGLYKVEHIAGLANGEATSFSANLQVNGAIKTTDSLVPGEQNVNMDITLTPRAE